jgi:ATP-dependent Lhr-like helicase
VEKKVILVNRAKGGQPPKFGGAGMAIHDVVRQEMFKLLCEGDYKIKVGEHRIEFADETAQSLFQEAAKFFQTANFAKANFIQQGNRVVILPWAGDRVVNTIVAVLISKGFAAGAFAGIIEIEKADAQDVIDALRSFQTDGTISAEELAESIPEKAIDKFDEYLPENLLLAGYAARAFDVLSTKLKIKELLTDFVS